MSVRPICAYAGGHWQNGIEAASRIGELVPKTKILFVTQNKDADVLTAALSNGAGGYILKADAGAELLPGIEALLRGEKFVSSRLEGCH